jgi:inositol-hexakisphosphate kinase
LLPVRHEPINGVVPIPRPVNPKEAQTQRDKRVEFFLLLEDLTAGMKRPCIMDLKMGTRQYGVDANKKKQSSQRRKCAETTSKELGVRVCGLQVWDVTTKSYIFQDKYFGRKLKVGREFQDALQRFLFDGVNYTSILRHIPTILHKLSELEVLIEDLRGYRFYAASLLMFYDGDVDDEGDNTYTSTTAKHPKASKREIDFKIADFANCVTAENDSFAFKERACPPQHPNEPDKGFLRGLKSLRKYFIDIQKEVVEIERRRGVNVEEGKDIITNGHELIDDPLDEDLGEVSY